MKTISTMFLLCGLMLLAGCFGNNVGTSPSVPESVEGAAGAGAAGTPEPLQFDSASNGGSGLAAAAPYAGDGKATVQQNVNPTPFMTVSTPAKGGMALPGNALISRADGTMSGPGDMSPAGADAGVGATPRPAAVPAQAKKPAATPK